MELKKEGLECQFFISSSLYGSDSAEKETVWPFWGQNRKESLLTVELFHVYVASCFDLLLFISIPHHSMLMVLHAVTFIPVHDWREKLPVQLGLTADFKFIYRKIASRNMFFALPKIIFFIKQTNTQFFYRFMGSFC